jgi:hypothetical protein
VSDPTLDEVLQAVDGLRAEVATMRAELSALRAVVDGLEARHADEDRAKEAELDPETLAMMAAVVTTYLGKRVRVRSARRVTPGADEAPAWARHGRAAIQTSHRLPRGH